MKLSNGRYYIDVHVEPTPEGQLKLNFPFNREFLEIVKSSFTGARWNPEEKCWLIDDDDHNAWQLAFRRGENPYAEFDKPVELLPQGERKLYSHQLELASIWYHHKVAIWAAEMGTGKTLAAIEVIERTGLTDVWWVAPKQTLPAIHLEFLKWNAKVIPKFINYEMLGKVGGTPQILVFDESQKLKNSQTQRTKAAAALAKRVRDKGGYVLLMSGTPAPRSPEDWWSQCEIARPGFLKEGNPRRFKERLALVEKKENPYTNTPYQSLVTWWDDENKCKTCGKTLKDHTAWDHPHVKSTNEVAALYKRMAGLVMVKFKKDCLELPDKLYRRILLKPDPTTLRAARMIFGQATYVLEKLRELSDGFQYLEDGSIKTFSTPKDQALLDLMEEAEDRIVIYGGFTATIDKLVKFVEAAGWDYIRVDGRGWSSTLGSSDPMTLIPLFQSNSDKRIAFIGHPRSAGMGLTLTASNMAVYYSNDFSGEARIQSEDRIHRPGQTKAVYIVDLIHLPTDTLVLENLNKKRELQSISLGEISEAFERV
jgi:SNF2 family DNA or RNA helicase